MQADWDFCLRLAVAGARFQAVPENIAIVRRRPDSISSRRQAELGPVALSVFDRHLGGHARCPACGRVEAVWRRPLLNREALRLAGKIGLKGRPAKWIGTLFAVLRQPRLIGAAIDEFSLAAARQIQRVTTWLAKLAPRRAHH